MACPRPAGHDEFERLMQLLADNRLLPEDLNLADLELLLTHIGPAPTLTALVHFAREDVRWLEESWAMSAHEPPG